MVLEDLYIFNKLHLYICLFLSWVAKVVFVGPMYTWG